MLSAPHATLAGAESQCALMPLPIRSTGLESLFVLMAGIANLIPGLYVACPGVVGNAQVDWALFDQPGGDKRRRLTVCARAGDP